jgi:hypothetical protein
MSHTRDNILVTIDTKERTPVSYLLALVEDSQVDKLLVVQHVAVLGALDA